MRELTNTRTHKTKYFPLGKNKNSSHSCILDHTLLDTFTHADRNNHCTTVSRANNRKGLYTLDGVCVCVSFTLGFWRSKHTSVPSPGYHLGSIQRLGLSDDADSLFGVVEVVQVDADDAVPLLRILVSQHGLFVPGRDAMRVRCRLSNAGSQQMRGHVSISYCGDSSCSVLLNVFLLQNQTPGTLLLKHSLFRGCINGVRNQ